MECFVSTQRSVSRGSSRLQAGLNIGRVRNNEEAAASNATLEFKHKVNAKSTSKIKALMSILVNVGFSNSVNNQEPNNNFGSSHLEPVNSVNGIRFKSKGKLNVNNTEATTMRVIGIGSPIFGVPLTSAMIFWEGQGYIAPQPTVVANFGAVETGGVVESSKSTVRVKNGGVRFWKLCTENYCLPVPISLFADVKIKSKFNNTYTDKIGGHTDQINKFENFKATQKFYPIRDIVTSKNNVSFVDHNLSPSGLYKSVDEGLFTGNYTKNHKTSIRINDEFNTFIQPSSVYSDGDFRYKCELTPPAIKPIENFLFIRAAAPMAVFESDDAPDFKIHNIRWEDPSGNLIAKYKDITLTGDGDFEEQNEKYNFATYVTEPEYNNANRNNWDELVPIFGESSGYTLNMDFQVTCNHDPFSDEFDKKSYENQCEIHELIGGNNDYLALDGAPISAQSQGFEFTPNASIRISNIEIVASGSVDGLLAEDFFGLYAKSVEEGLSLEKKLYPSKILPNGFSNGILPEVDSVWKSTHDGKAYYNNVPADLVELSKSLNDFVNFRSIELVSTSPIADSGKLQIVYSHQPATRVTQRSGGAFSIGKLRLDSNLDIAKSTVEQVEKEYFTVESIELKVLAKKASSSTRDFTLDVVGYCDDGLFNVTSAVDGFLQNSTTGLGTVPLSSGFDNSDYLAKSAESISSRDEYFENRPVAFNPGGDHHLITQSILKIGEDQYENTTRTPSMVDSTEYAEYIVPLQISARDRELGVAEAFKISPFFEALHLDIYPLPVGAVIARAELIIKYRPSAAMHLHTFGYGDTELSRRANNLFTAPMGKSDHKINATLGSKPLSLIENIPHGFNTPETIKTNYSKRWRGVDGVSRSGPFDPPAFDESFYNPQLEKPFLNGYYTFRNTDGNTIYPDDSFIDNSGVFNTLLSSNIINSVGMRFRTDHLFASQERSYTTIDWTSTGHELHGKITDSFENALRVNQSNANINFGDVSCSGGFSVFARFSPDVNISGVDYNLFNSGVIVSKWDAGKDLELAIGYKDGHITGYARDIHGNNIEVQDTLVYTDYQYPVPVLLTYNDNNSKSLRLYTDNEIINSGSFDILRSSSSPFVMASGDSDLIFGHSYGSGVGINAFITDVGISQDDTYGSILVSGDFADASKQQTTAERFFDSFRSKFWNDEESYTHDRYKLWDFVDEDSNKWHIGAFKYCEFGPAYDTLTSKIGNDYIVHNFKTNDGESYENNTQLSLPSNVVTDGLAYHTQLENDMFRMHLSDVSDKLVSIAPRISKRVPTGYNFAKEAVVVDTVVEHETTNDIIWPDGKIGPRLIVSLYTKTKETDLFETENWGLVNRDIHYIGPRDCWQKLTSQFTLESVTDTHTEPWANFDRQQLIQERGHYLDAEDMNDMFVQYDLAYPSGSYDSTIRIHSSHVRLEDALHLKDVSYIDDFYLHVGGEAISFTQMNLSVSEKGIATTPSSGLSLYTAGLPWTQIDSSGVGYFGPPLYTSATYSTDFHDYEAPDPHLGLYFHSVTGIKVEPPNQFNLHTLGIMSWFGGSSSSSDGGFFGAPPQQDDTQFTNDPVLFGSSDDVEVDPLGSFVNLLLDFEDPNGASRDISGKANHGSQHHSILWPTSSRTYSRNLVTTDLYRNFGRRSVKIYDQATANYGTPLPRTYYGTDFRTLALDPKIWTSKWTLEFAIRITDPLLETGRNKLKMFTSNIFGVNAIRSALGDPYASLDKSMARTRWYQLRDGENYSTGYRARSSDGKPVGFNTVEAGMTLGIHTYVDENKDIDERLLSQMHGPWLPTGSRHSITLQYLSAIPEGVIRTNQDFSNDYLEETCRGYTVTANITPDYDNWNYVSISAVDDKIYIMFNGVIVGEQDYFGWPDIEALVEPQFLTRQMRERDYRTSYPELTLHSDAFSIADNVTHGRSATYAYYLDDLRLTLGRSRISVEDDVAVPSVEGQKLIPVPPEGVFPIEYSLPDPSVNATTTTTLPPPPPPTFFRETGCTLFLLNRDRFVYDHVESELDFFLRGIDSNGNEANEFSADANLYTFGGGTRYSSGANPREPRGRTRKERFNLYVGLDRVQTESGGEFKDTTFNLYVNAYDPTIVTSSGTMSLHTLNISPLGWENYLQTFTWDSENTGSDIVLTDNPLLSLDADDEIRGVVTMCYGDCGNEYSCDEVDIITHDTVWYSKTCVDGGVIRPKTIYNNPNVTAFNTVTSGYDRNYYGVRKFENLIPGAPYSLFITAKTGDDGVLEVPREISEWGYGTNDEVDYSGIKIVPKDLERGLNDKFGYSVDVVDDLMAIGVPHYDMVEHDGSIATNAGSVFVYRRDPSPSGNDWSDQPDQSNWSFEAQLSLPTGYLIDNYKDSEFPIFSPNRGRGDLVVGIGLERQWYVGQKGRELGHSVSISKHDGKEIIVAGAPGSKWNRTFEDVEAEPVNIALFVFTDEFFPVNPYPYIPSGRRRSTTPDDLLPLIKDKDLLFRYFSDPPVKFNVNIIICEGILGTNIPAGPTWEDCPIPEPDFVFREEVHRVAGNTPSTIEASNQQLFTDLKDIYNKYYPQDTSKQNNNQPAIMGFFVDTSISYGTRAVGSTSNTKLEGNGGLERFLTWVRQEAYDNGLTNHLNQPSRPSIVTSIGGDDGRDDTGVSASSDETFKSIENWYGQVAEILESTLNINRLIETQDYKLFAGSNFGTFNTSTEGFNIPPASGGAVFVFEKFDDGWKTVQKIDSPTTANDVPVDRFGHDVSISDDGSALVVGSPYMKEAVRVYERPYYYNNFNVLLDYFGSWIQTIGNSDHIELREAKTSYLFRSRNAINFGGLRGAAESVYDELSPSGQYTFREAFNESYGGWFLSSSMQAPSVGHSWGWLTSLYMPNPRFGYSVDLNEDGTLLAIGCPTDSIGATDDGILWYKPGPKSSDPNQWFSNVNAGAVRVLQARKYYRHSKVMQYGAWGNLHRSLAKTKYLLEDEDRTIDDADQHLDRYYNGLMSSVYRDRYLESNFEDPEIPEDVGLLFIITPEVDRLSKEYIDNIQDWLGLGDRHLVIVGDDPIYETDQFGRVGAYNASNNIINRLLDNLDSRMRLYPAANRYESMVDQDTGLYYNNIPSFRPDRTTYTSLSGGNMRGSGVADIRLYDEGLYKAYSCSAPKVDNILQGLDGISSLINAGKQQGYFELNGRCNHVIKHEGDLRAEWSEECFDCQQKKKSYKVNIAFAYGTHNLPETYNCGCCDSAIPCPEFPKKNYEPIPILAAAEKKIIVNHIPATGPRYKQERYISGYKTLVNAPDFDDNLVGTDIEFAWTHDSGNYTYLNYNEFGTQSNSLFFDEGDPILQQNGKHALLMAKAEKTEETEDYNIVIQEEFPICVQEELSGTEKSKVIVMTTTELETQRSLAAGSDENVIFYMNLLDKTSNGETRVAQLGDWTGRTSFKAGYTESELASTFKWVLNYDVFENVQMSEINQIASNFDVLWIANTENIPSDQEAGQLRLWLNGGENRKIVFTVGKDTNQSSFEDDEGDVFNPSDELERIFNRMSKLETTLSKIGSKIKPLFLDSKHRYATLADKGLPNLPLERPLAGAGGIDTDYMYVNPFETDFINGKRGDISFLRSVNSDTVDTSNVICMEEVFGVTTLLYWDATIVDKKTADTGTPFMRTGTTRVDFPVEPEENYRFFATLVAERPTEDRVLNFYITDVNSSASNIKQSTATDKLQEMLDPRVYGPDEMVDVAEINRGFSLYYRQDPDQRGAAIEDDNYPINNYGGIPYTHHFDICVPSGVSGISVYINSDYMGVEQLNPDLIYTERLIAISGAKIGTFTTTDQFPVYSIRTVKVSDGTPATTTTQELIQEISSESSQYCPTDFCAGDSGYGTPGPQIHDGPVTVAQEVYHQRPFLSGYEKSRITVISDASLIQGSNVVLPDREDWVNGDVLDFLYSLYPEWPEDMEEGDEYGGSIRYESMLKIVSPEKASPAKLMSSEINSGFNNLFGGYPQSSIKNPSSFGNSEKEFEFPSRDWISPMEPVLSKGPSHVTPRSPMPPITDEAKYAARSGHVASFSGQMVSMGTWCRFKVDIDGVTYEDNGYNEGRNSLQRTFGYDFLDFHEMRPHISGYPGDLFGYKVKIHKNELYVSSPFAPFSGEAITDWNDVVSNSPKSPLLNSVLGYDGGAGSVYKFTKDYNVTSLNRAVQTAWSCTDKFRPDTLSAGDQFGMSFDIDGDVLVISAPSHDGTSNIVKTADVGASGEFVRKEFNDQFDITQIDKNDLAVGGSGNQGAVYTYENKISDWGTKKQDWVFIQKLIPQGYNAVNENDYFGRSVAVDRYAKSDQDYALMVGSPSHAYGSGIESSILSSGGAVYHYDAMLRRQAPSFAHPDTNLEGRIFGSMNVQDHEKYLLFDFKNGTKTNNNLYKTGLVFANERGEIFVEASGQDSNPKGYVSHRPFIERIDGAYYFGTFLAGYNRLFISGKPPSAESSMNLIKPSGLGNVYNDIELRTFGILGIADNSGDDIFNLSVSGSLMDSINNSGDPLNMHVETSSSGVDEMILHTKGHFQP